MKNKYIAEIELDLTDPKHKDYFYILGKNKLGLKESEIVEQYRRIKETFEDEGEENPSTLIKIAPLSEEQLESLKEEAKIYNFDYYITTIEDEFKKLMEDDKVDGKIKEQISKMKERAELSETIKDIIKNLKTLTEKEKSLPTESEDDEIDESEKTPKRKFEDSHPQRNFKNPTNTCHYIKYPLTESLSLRYFINFEDRPNLNKKWVLKDHDSGSFDRIDKKAIIEQLKTMTINEPVEILGRLIDGKYIKTYFNMEGHLIKSEVE